MALPVKETIHIRQIIMTTTLQQIADHVGVSKQAVSYAINNKPGQVSKATRQRILDAAQRMNYQPNWRARSFARRRSQVIGLVYGRPADYVERSQMASALVEQLAKLDHELMLIPAMGPVDQWAHKLRDGRVDGALITHPMPLGLDDFVAEHRLPAVFMNLRSELDVPQVYFNDAGGAQQAMEHLLELGHQHISYYCYPKRDGEHYSNADRETGYRTAMRAAGLSEHEEVVIDEFDAFANDLASRPADQRPTALLIYNDHDSMHLMQQLWYRDIQVPRDLSVVSFNNDKSTQAMIPPMTCVATPAEQLARKAVDLLMDQIENPQITDHEPVIFEEQLVVRQSTAPFVPSHHV